MNSNMEKRFEISPRRVLGVYARDAALFLVEMERQEGNGRFSVCQARQEKAGRDETIPEALARLCAVYGLPAAHVSLCLPRELFFTYTREFPPMPP